MKKVMTIILLVFIFTSFLIPNYTEAATPSEIIDRAKGFLNSGDQIDDEVFKHDETKKAIDEMYYSVLSIGIVIAIFVGMVLGIKFITGGVSEKAKIKESLIPFAIGAIVIFGAFGIWRLVLNVMQSTFE